MPDMDPKPLRTGMSLIETLIGLSLFLIITTTALEGYAALRDHFNRARDEAEIREGIYAALTTMRIDLNESGRGLARAVSLGLIEGFRPGEAGFHVFSLDTRLEAVSDLTAGQTSLALRSAAEVRRGRRICLIQGSRGETAEIASVTGNRILLCAPLENGYDRDSMRILLLREVACFFDQKNTLRRRVNTSSAQPLMEDAAGLRVENTDSGPLVRVSLRHSLEKEHSHELAVVLKNLALAGTR